MRDSGRAERPLSFAPDPQDVTVGEEGIHPHPSKTPRYEEAHLRLRNQQVSIISQRISDASVSVNDVSFFVWLSANFWRTVS